MRSSGKSGVSVESDDDNMESAYTSAQAGRTRSRCSGRNSSNASESQQEDSEEIIMPLKYDRRELSEDSFMPSESVAENASYPKATAFSIMRQHSWGKVENGSTGRFDFSKPGIYFLKDPPDQITMGRKIALWLEHIKLYNPRAALEFMECDDVEAIDEGSSNHPSLQKAWAYFEHVVLTRYVVKPHNINVEGWGWIRKFIHSFKNSKEEFERAQPGENQRPTKLYDAITTPHMQLGDFGLGFGLYFSTLRAMGYILFVAGCLSLFNIFFFASDDYSIPGTIASNPFLYGSAICTNTTWELCVDCSCSNATQGWPRTSRCATTAEGLTMILKNNCLQQDWFFRKVALVNYCTVLFLVLSILALGVVLTNETIRFDEDEQTAQDYSIQISNPPPKATNPDEWKDFFEKNFPGTKCAAVTCAVNNDLLVRDLVARREVLRMMELQLDPGTPMDIDHLALLAAKAARKNRGVLKRIMAVFIPQLPELLSRLVALNTSIKGLAQLGYPCTNVFVTFEKESSQREVLGRLSVGIFHVRRNNTKVLGNEKYLFHGKVLEVLESVEPNSVRWQDLNATMAERTDQVLLTSIITFGSIIAVAKIVQIADTLQYVGAAFCIAAFNLTFPDFAKVLVNLESHPTESKLQMSLYWKIALFRWVNTAIVITVITPFTHTLGLEDGLIPQIYSIFFAEIVTTNVIQMTDVWGHFQRHILAPRAKTQDTMNLCFQGLEVELAERYTNMTKIIFLAFWYCSIFPQALFLAALALLFNYYTDRFSLMRTWKRAPHVSTEISTYSRRYFISSACIFLAAMSSFYWSAFPFDNLCAAGDLEKGFEGTYAATIYNRFDTAFKNADIELEANSTQFKFCEQDFILGSLGTTYPFFPQEWTTGEDRWIAYLFAWTSVAVMSLVGAKFFLFILEWMKSVFAGSTYKECGDDQGVNFHDVRNMTGYIPQVRSRIFSYPLIACKCDKIGQQLFDWTDPDRDYTYYDLTKDADHILSGTNRRAKHSFSRVKHYLPNRLDDIRARKRHLEMRILKGKNVFNSVAAIDVGNLSKSIHKLAPSVSSRQSIDFRRRTSQGEPSATRELGTLVDNEEG